MDEVRLLPRFGFLKLNLNNITLITHFVRSFNRH